MKRIYLFLFLTCLICSGSTAFGQTKWKAYRYEILFGAGAANFLGELGGANQIATHGLRDLKFKATRPGATLGVRYKLSPYFALRSNFTYGRLKGDDKYTNEAFRKFRNLNFFSNTYEFSVNFEAAFMKEQIGHKYRLREVKGRRGFEIYMYGFAGLSVFHFNPKTRDQNGKVQALQPLHTEGQGLIPSRKPYHRTAVSIPIGMGFKYSVSKRWSVCLEYGLRMTFTDYIDDVSTTYVDPSTLAAQPNGNIAIQLANRSNNNKPNVPNPQFAGVAAAGQQRGDPRYNDAYMIAIITANYKLRTTRGSLPKF